MTNKKFLIVGRTGSGKTTLAKGVSSKLKIPILKSYCTRPPRIGENDPDHIFIKPSEVKRYKDRMIAYTDKVDQYERFSTIEQLKESMICIIDPYGIEYLKSLKFPELQNMNFIEIYVTIPHFLTIQRIKQRGDNIEDFLERYDAEHCQFDRYEQQESFNHKILNIYTPEKGIDELCKIISDEIHSNN